MNWLFFTLYVSTLTIIIIYFYTVATYLWDTPVEGFQSGMELTYPSWCILLTTCVNRQNDTLDKYTKRIDMYRNTIARWLETGLPIFVIDSSDYPFDEFKDTSVIVTHFMCEDHSSSSIGEATSILYCLENCPEINNYRNILKVTGRYSFAIPEKILSKIGNDSDLYIQNIVNDKIKWQNSEVFGFNRNIAKEVFQPIIDDKLLMENQLWNVSRSGKYNVLILPSMPNTRRIRRGGDNALLKAL
jgi:hypothetical protein